MLGVDCIREYEQWRNLNHLQHHNDEMLVIGMSANASTEDQKEGLSAGMHFFASKPVDVHLLSLIIQWKSNEKSLEKVIFNLESLAISHDDNDDVYSSTNNSLRSRSKNCSREDLVSMGGEDYKDTISSNKYLQYTVSDGSSKSLGKRIPVKNQFPSLTSFSPRIVFDFIFKFKS